jgi:glycogen phosphorylase
LHDIDAVEMHFVDAVDAAGPVGTGGGGADAAFRYEAALTLARSGPVGYTVRILPRHELLASPAELGLVASA